MYVCTMKKILYHYACVVIYISYINHRCIQHAPRHSKFTELKIYSLKIISKWKYNPGKYKTFAVVFMKICNEIY